MDSQSSASEQYAHLDTAVEFGMPSAKKNLGHRSYAPIKRIFDLVFVLAVTPIVLPLSFAVAALVWLGSPGPIFFAQQRLRQRGETFHLWKFRTMCDDADEVLARYLAEDEAARAEWAVRHKLKDDPRINQVGRFLRSTSLDELPQFFNVLQGDMSIVGPRPIVQAEVKRYGPHFADYCRVKPGLTGLWQVSGRSRLTFEQRVLLDRDYAVDCSLLGDLKILARTVHAVFRRDGAY